MTEKFQEPYLTIHPTGSAYINKSAMERWFSDVDYVSYYINKENKQFALKPDEPHKHSYKLIDNGAGAIITLEGVLNYLSIEYEGFEPNHYAKLRLREGLILPDLSYIVSSETSSPSEFQKYTQKQNKSTDGEWLIIKDLQHVAEKIGRPPNTKEHHKYGNYTRGALYHYFDGIEEALRAANLDPDKRDSGGISTEDLIADLRAGAEILGHSPDSYEYRLWGEYSPTVYFQRFGSWSEALEAAGLESKEKTEG